MDCHKHRDSKQLVPTATIRTDSTSGEISPLFRLTTMKINPRRNDYPLTTGIVSVSDSTNQRQSFMIPRIITTDLQPVEKWDWLIVSCQSAADLGCSEVPVPFFHQAANVPSTEFEPTKENS